MIFIFLSVIRRFQMCFFVMDSILGPDLCLEILWQGESESDIVKLLDVYSKHSHLTETAKDSAFLADCQRFALSYAGSMRQDILRQKTAHRKAHPGTAMS